MGPTATDVMRLFDCLYMLDTAMIAVKISKLIQMLFGVVDTGEP